MIALMVNRLDSRPMFDSWDTRVWRARGPSDLPFPVQEGRAVSVVRRTVDAQTALCAGATTC